MTALDDPTMRSVRSRLSADTPPVEGTGVVVDRKPLRHNAGNIRYNAGIRSVLRLAGTPFTVVLRKLRRR